jgi:23S rRNA (adenine2503-C2)-methyltransferase
MKVSAYTGHDDMAIVYIAETEDGRMVEFSEALQPPLPRSKKWVIMLSTLFGCPVRCPMCDAGGDYRGKLSGDEILFQIDFLINKRFPGGNIPVDKFKVQFARMGEPSLNPNVIDILEELPHRYNAPGLLPCVSTVAPAGSDGFFERLLNIKKTLYADNFQLQFSIHSTDLDTRNRLIPTPKWDFAEIADYGKRFYDHGGRKITLNCALIDGAPVEPDILREYFDPEFFLIKATPLNPTYRAAKNGLSSYIDPCQAGEDYDVIQKLRSRGYEVIVSIGEVDENYIGSNCGQYVLNHLRETMNLKDGYDYRVEEYHKDNVTL